MIYGYARVSTKKQSLKMQFEELMKFGCDEIVQEKFRRWRIVRSSMNY
jgi:DNA invertase Pin-like site-specific DNA recombinase